MKSCEALDQWTPALPPLRRLERDGARLVLRILEICSGCSSVSAAVAKAPGLDTRSFMKELQPPCATVTYCRYGWNRRKARSIWTNSRRWRPEPRCVPSNPCARFREHGNHLVRFQRANQSAPDFAALPELLVRAWTHAALMDILGESRWLPALGTLLASCAPANVMRGRMFSVVLGDRT